MTKHLLGDGSTPGNAREVTYEAVAPMVRHALTGSYYGDNDEEDNPAPKARKTRAKASKK